MCLAPAPRNRTAGTRLGGPSPSSAGACSQPLISNPTSSTTTFGHLSRIKPKQPSLPDSSSFLQNRHVRRATLAHDGSTGSTSASSALIFFLPDLLGGRLAPFRYLSRMSPFHVEATMADQGCGRYSPFLFSSLSSLLSSFVT